MNIRNTKRSSTAKANGATQSAAHVTDPPDGRPFPVAGVGASAGGLEAFTALLKALPHDTGMAFVLVQHMDPAHDSALSQILSRATEMPVDEITDGMAVKPNHVYVIPSKADITIRGGILRLAERQEVARRHLPIDRFLGSLAEDRKSAAIGIILSGTASDGTQGLKTIKAEGGVTFAQDEKSARYAGMPMSAVAAGCVDFVLTPEKIAAELTRISRHPYIAIAQPAQIAGLGDEGGGAFRQICVLLRSATQVDFLEYKPATISRRIGRRMALKRIESLEKYLHLLRKDSTEVEALFQDILVHVTGFFRDPAAFQVLRTKVLGKITAGSTGGAPIRVWVPGCSTGEEVYSIAMLLLEALGDATGQTKMQVFGTDISEPLIQHARAGTYPEASLANLSCRNVLIYLGAPLQKKTIEIFHYALRQGGYLFLGQSESLSAHANLFALEDRKHKVFSRKLAPVPHFDMAAGVREKSGQPLPEGVPPRAIFDPRKVAERILLDRFAPAAIVVDQDLHIVHFQGDTSSYLAPATGQPSFHLLRILRPELVVEVRAAIQKVRKQGASTCTGAIRFKHHSGVKTVRVEVAPLPGSRAKGCDFLVLFREETVSRIPSGAQDAAISEIKGEGASRDVLRLQKELTSTRDYLRSLVEDHEATYEELKAANEEVLSANEELQSTNEELETTKEELQSSNEELTTLNEELQNRNIELVQVANDLNNLLVGVNIPIAILDHDLRIRRFTPMAEKILNLIPADVGRAFGQIASNLEVADWDQWFSEVLDHLHIVEREVQDKHGHWYSLRMRPYKTADNKIDGVLIALLDIDPVKRSLEQARQSRDYAEAIVETIREPLLVLDAEMCVLSANSSFYQTFRTSARETLDRRVFELGDGQWNIPPLRRLLEELLPQHTRIDDFAVDHLFPAIGHRHMLFNARQVSRAGVGRDMILVAIKDVTEQREGSEALRASEARYRAIVEDQTELIARFLPDETLIFANEAHYRYFGARPEEIKGRSFIDQLVADVDREATRQFLATLTVENPVGTFVRHMAAPGGRWRQWIIRAFFDDEGRPVEYQSVGRDITELKQKEEALLQSQQELRTLAAKLISAQEDTSKQLARELHDVFSQKLAVLGMAISALEQRTPKSSTALGERLRQIAGQIGGLAKDIHQMARQLHPSILDDLGLAAALNNECQAFSEHYGVSAEFKACDAKMPLPEDVSLCLYRVAQEALRNIGKHARATRIRADLIGGGEEIMLVIEDLGDGFSVEEVRGKGGLGLISMDERVRLVNGTFTIQSDPGMGTRVEVRVPLPRREA